MNIWIDGAGAPMENQKAVVCVVFEDKEKVWRYGSSTNNEMEYQALLNALRDERSKEATIYTDSQLVIGQLTKGWKVKAQNLQEIHNKCSKLMEERKAKLVWIPRDANKAGKILER